MGIRDPNPSGERENPKLAPPGVGMGMGRVWENPKPPGWEQEVPFSPFILQNGFFWDLTQAKGGISAPNPQKWKEISMDSSGFVEDPLQSPPPRPIPPQKFPQMGKIANLP